MEGFGLQKNLCGKQRKRKAIDKTGPDLLHRIATGSGVFVPVTRRVKPITPEKSSS